HGDVIRERGVERLGCPLRRRPSLDVEAHDVRERVHTGVRATRNGEPVPHGEDGVEPLSDDAFDRAQSGLRGPTAKAAAVVPDRELQAHVRRPSLRLSGLPYALLTCYSLAILYRCRTNRSSPSSAYSPRWSAWSTDRCRPSRRSSRSPWRATTRA